MVIGKGLSVGYLANEEISNIVQEGLESMELDDQRVLVLIPDGTRTMPMPMMFQLLARLLNQRVKKLDYLVASGTHPPLNAAQLSKLVGKSVRKGKVGHTHVYNHEWHKPETFACIGTLAAIEIEQISGGLISQDVPVKLNKLILYYDQIIICGPVYPHEVVGFSGGNKYFFPGVAGPEIINFTHWLGALITSYQLIGTLFSPVRVVIERAAEFVRTPTSLFGFVVDQRGVAGLYVGPVRDAWQEAAKLSAQRHIIYVEKPYQRVLSIMPKMYEDLWTAAKGMYKLEPVVADGGEIIIYAPHIDEVSYTHGKLLDEIGYHCRDYYLAEWDRFKAYPGGVLAHSTHLKGLGKFDPVNRFEIPRIQVTLATGIPAERCKRINLGYMDPKTIDISKWQNREAEGILAVPHAGEMLYRLRRDRNAMA